MIEGFEVKVRKTPRKKSAAIHVLPEKTIEVIVPSDFTSKRIDQLLTTKRRWILSKIKEVTERPEVQPKEFVSGESFILFGKPYRLKVATKSVGVVTVDSDRILILLPKGLDKEERPMVAREMLLEWYQQKAEKKFKARLSYYAKKLGCEFSGFSVKDFKARWGSCSPSGHISLNWRLAMAPTSVIDYVVVHELVHLEIRGHGAEYWEKVSYVLRDFKERRVELKRLHAELYSF